MDTLEVKNLSNESTGTIALNSQIAETEYHPHIIHDVVVQYLAGLRQGTHSTKTRSEVAGSNSKPWRQKGTGRARAGTVKSPLWRHGGVVFGPKPRNYATSINKKVRKKALRSAFAQKIRQNELTVVETMQIELPKTKIIKSILDVLGVHKALIIVEEITENLKRSTRNLKHVEVIHHSSVNVYRLVRYDNVIVTKTAFAELEKRLLS